MLAGFAPVAVGAEWIPPVDAPVVDPFREPTTGYGPGNRGLEYALGPGQAVSAVDDGRVTFVGAVGRSRHVVVEHSGGLRSTYAFVADIAVVRGQRVAQGQQLATAGPGFHLTARVGDTYIDPALLFAGAEVGVRLVDIGAPLVAPSRRVAPERAGSFDDKLAVLDAVVDLTLPSQLAGLADAAHAWFRLDCTPDGSTPSGSTVPRALIQVGGLGTDDGGASIGALDPVALGYGADDVVGYSYAGGCTPNPFGLDPASPTSLSASLPATTYQPADTYQDIDLSARRLADLVEVVAAQRPDHAIDIAAHSLGGVVARRALELLAGRQADGLSATLPAVVITIGSPHRGADLATAAVATSGSTVADAGLDPLLADDGAPRTAEAVAQIAEIGAGELPPPRRPPDGVRVVTVASSTDLIVPAHQAIWAGAVNTVISTPAIGALSAHGDLPARPEVQRELELAIAGLPPRCVALADVLLSAVSGQVAAAAENALTVLVGATGWVR